MQDRKYLSSSYARILFRHLRLSEEKSSAFFNGTTVSYDDLMSLDGSISGDELAQMYRNACAISGRDDLGLSVGTQLHLSTHGPLGVAIFSGPDPEKHCVCLPDTAKHDLIWCTFRSPKVQPA